MAAVSVQTSPTPRLLGERIRRRRREQGIRMVVLAQQARVSRSYLYDIEKGRIYPSLKILLRIADVLNCSVADLVGESVVSDYES